MRKRGIIQLGGVEPKIRISKPGVDVDLAGPTEFLLHESHLYTQPYHFSFVTCPFAGDTSRNARTSTVSVTVANVSSDPIVLLWPVDSDGVIASPISRATGSGSSANGFAMNNWDIWYDVFSATRVDVTFNKGAASLRSPNGAYLILVRSPS